MQPPNILLGENAIANTLTFFKKAMPQPTSKNFSTQLGCHFEEVREMVQELVPTDSVTHEITADVLNALERFANHLKQNEHCVSIGRRVDYVDALCDQIVTAVGCAHMAAMDIVGAMDEVNASNLSKFGEDGEPIFDANRKVMKGLNYRKADLASFV